MLKFISGSVKLESRSKAQSGMWRDLEPHWTPELDVHGSGRAWTTCKYVTSKSGDAYMKSSWIFFTCKVGLESICKLPN